MQSTIVFPEHDDSGLQKKTHRSIEALLGVCVRVHVCKQISYTLSLSYCFFFTGLPSPCLKSFSILCKHPSIARPLLAAVSYSNYSYCVYFMLSLSLPLDS